KSRQQSIPALNCVGGVQRRDLIHKPSGCGDKYRGMRKTLKGAHQAITPAQVNRVGGNRLVRRCWPQTRLLTHQVVVEVVLKKWGPVTSERGVLFPKFAI